MMYREIIIQILWGQNVEFLMWNIFVRNVTIWLSVFKITIVCWTLKFMCGFYLTENKFYLSYVDLTFNGDWETRCCLLWL